MGSFEPHRSVGSLLMWSAVALVLLGAGGQAIPTNDLHIFLAMGQTMAETGQLLEQETFTWTAPGAEFLHGPWGFSWLSWHVYDAVGLIGLRWINGLAAASTVWIVGRTARLRGADPRAAAFGCFFAAGLMIQNLTVRSQTWVFPLFAGLLWCLAKPRRLRLSLPFVVITGCLWTNLHGSFPAGLVAIGALGAGAVLQSKSFKAITPFALAGLCFGLGTLMGPYGADIYGYVLSNSSAPEARGLSEWGAPSLTTFSGARLAFALVVWALLLVRSPREMDWSDGLLSLAFAGLALTGTRFIAWFGIAAAVPFAMQVHRLMAPSQGLPPRLYRGIASAVGLYWAVVLGSALGPKTSELDPDTPIAGIAAIQESAPGGRLFNPPEWGGYATMTLGEAWKTSGDIRVWVFDDPSWRTYPVLVQAPDGWEEALDERSVSHLLLRKEHFHALLIEPARRSHKWTLLHEDEHSAAFQRVP
ncbi:MAG: hypothetical protein VXW32_06030 [Myxococcota bacterium]|nr:hypothetical protein [Myxococcota bacterium]